MSNGGVKAMKMNPWEFETQRLKFQEKKTEKIKKYLFQQSDGSIVWGILGTNTEQIERFMPWSVNIPTNSSQSKALCGVIFEDI